MKKTNKRQAKTRVVFRAFSDGEIIALFPHMTNGAFIGSYLHIGQHGDASRDVVEMTKPAKRSEYAALYRELRGIGYRMEVGTRVTREPKKRTYNEMKGTIRQRAQEWQMKSGERNLSYHDINRAGNYFARMGRRYGLLREFRENAIPC